jgi:hypothetical protein
LPIHRKRSAFALFRSRFRCQQAKLHCRGPACRSPVLLCGAQAFFLCS